MKKYFLFLGLTFLALSCRKDETNSPHQFKDFSRSAMESTTDPVIDYYSRYGSVERMSSMYEGQLNHICTNYKAIYQFVPSNGPYQGMTCEIYRFDKSSEVSGPCDDTFTLEKKEEPIGNNATYLTCIEDGSDCKELDSPWGCTLVFCDDDEEVL